LTTLKRVLLKTLTLPAVANTLSRLTGTGASIFMLHRFAAPDLGVAGHDVKALRRDLAYLRKQRYNPISLQDLFDKLRAGEPLKKAVAFTIDDGYFDHVQIGAPVFAEFDCPVTTYVATGFVDGKIWFWWDRLTYIFEGTRRTSLRAQLGTEEIDYPLGSAAERAAASRDLNGRFEDAGEQDRLDCIADLSREADVELPFRAPPRFAPLSWDEARAAEKRGMTFGPHTVTHPVLSSTPDAQSEFEIVESWNRLRAEVSRPVPIFCYPSGRPRDFGEREIATLHRLGFHGAVQGQNGESVRGAVFRASETARFRVPRFPYQDRLLHVVQCVSGVETVKARIRGAVKRSGPPASSPARNPR
jgi:peptidoglycan/xylan/chitin deacetylase (PgdA/CDA1 family)